MTGEPGMKECGATLLAPHDRRMLGAGHVGQLIVTLHFTARHRSVWAVGAAPVACFIAIGDFRRSESGCCSSQPQEERYRACFPLTRFHRLRAFGV
jgi:hypothetical protein